MIGGSAGIGLATARRARAEGADVILTGRDPERLRARGGGARRAASPPSTPPTRSASRGSSTACRRRSTTSWSRPAGRTTRRWPSSTSTQARRDVDAHLWLPFHVARAVPRTVRPGGTLLFISGTGGRRPGVGLALIGALTAAHPALVANLAVELAPVRVNLIAAGFVDTPLSASLLGDQLEERREQLRATLPIGRVVDGRRRRRARRAPDVEHARSRARRTTSTAASRSSPADRGTRRRLATLAA